MNSLNVNFKSLFDWKTIILLVAVIFISYIQCNEIRSTGDVVIIDKQKYQIKKKSIDTAYVSKKDVQYRPGKDIYSIFIKTDTILGIEKVDTTEILKGYFSKILYIDTLNFKDSLGYVIIEDTISRNSILGRTYKSDIKQMIIRDTTWLVEVPTPELYFGGNAGISKTKLPNQVGVSFLYKTPNDMIYGLGAGLQNGPVVAPYINGSVYWKISFKKNKNAKSKSQ